MSAEAKKKLIDKIIDRITEYDKTFKPDVLHPILIGGIIRILDEELPDNVCVGNTIPDTESKCNKHNVKHCCVHCGKSVVFDDYSATWIHDREYKERDNGLYCFEDTTYFTAAPHNSV